MADPKPRILIVPEAEVILVPIAPPNPRFVANRFVLVVFVPVAFVQVIFVGFKEETMRFVKVPFVEKKFVLVAFVLVTFVKMAEDGVVRPMEILLIVPPVNVTLEEEREPIVALFAFKVVPEAMPVHAKLVEVAPVALAEKAMVRSVVEKRSVPVADPKPRMLIVPEAEVRLPAVMAPTPIVFALKVEPLAFTKVRFVLETLTSVELEAMRAPMMPLFV